MRRATALSAFIGLAALSAGCAGMDGDVEGEDPEAQENAAIRAAEPHERQAESAEDAGKMREALRHYLAAVRSMPGGTLTAKDVELRRKVIALVRKLDPPPSVPEEAQESLDRAEARAKDAKKEPEYLDAAAEYMKGLRGAPWVAKAYYNLGLLCELANDYGRASRSLRLYLAADPEAPEAVEVKRKIAALDVKHEKLHSFEGTWCLVRQDGTLWPYLMIERGAHGWIVRLLDLQNGGPRTDFTYSDIKAAGRSMHANTFYTHSLRGITYGDEGSVVWQLSKDGKSLVENSRYEQKTFDLETGDVVEERMERGRAKLVRKP